MNEWMDFFNPIISFFNFFLIKYDTFNAELLKSNQIIYNISVYDVDQ